MEKSDKKVLELFLGLIFVAVLGLICVIVLYFPGISQNTSTGTTSNVISNSYNTNSYNNYNSEPSTKLVVVSKQDFTEKNYDWEYKKDFQNKYLDYSSYGEHSREETIFNNYRDEFKVHVVNKDYVGGYFKVKFYFCNYYENCFTRTIEKYIPAKEEKEFSYVDVHLGKLDYYDWSYKVFPEEIKP